MLSYRNFRKDGRGVIEVDAAAADNVRRMFHLYAYEPLTIDEVVAKLQAEGRTFRPASPRFPRSSVHNILGDRAYIGEIEHKGQWYRGKHEKLVDRATWDRVQALLGGHVYHAHNLTYAGEFMKCGCCGHAVTGEQVRKKSNSGEKAYHYIVVPENLC